MKSGITRRLITYFVGVIVLFALIISILFAMMYRNQTVNLVKEQILQDTRDLAALIESEDATNEEVLRQFKNISDYLNDAQLWIVTSDGIIWSRSKSGTMGPGMGMHNNVSTLTDRVRNVILAVLEGNEKTSESFSDIYKARTITIGVPVYGPNDVVIAAVLVNASVTMIQSTANAGIRILVVSTLIGIAIAILAGYLLSKKFIQPLIAMDHTVTQLANGNYQIRIQEHGKDEIGDLGRNLNVLGKRLEEAARQSANLEKMRQNFIADITHELRTPVTVLRGYAEGLKDNIYPEGYTLTDVSTQMIRECSGMQRLIGDLLELSRLEDPDFKLVTNDLELHDVLNDVLRGSAQRMLLNQVELETDIEDGVWKINGDYDRLRMMLNAVMDNAIKFTPSGKKIHVRAKKEAGSILISVRDEGPGMSQERIGQLFKRYQRVKDTTNPQGSGLGLAIAENIARRHNIKIEVVSKENEGSTFTFRLKNL